jgi:hypothetical protein
MRNEYQNLVETSKRKTHLGELREGGIILNGYDLSGWG